MGDNSYEGAQSNVNGDEVRCHGPGVVPCQE